VDGINKAKEGSTNKTNGKPNGLPVSNAEVQQLERYLVQSLTKLIIFCSKEGNKPEVLYRPGQ
jgi:hypothetical protein